MAVVRIPDNVQVDGNLTVNGTQNIKRSQLVQEDLLTYGINPLSWRIYDNLASLLPVAAAGDDLGSTATIGSSFPYLDTGDIKTTSSTRYARTQFLLPVEYVAGQSVTLRMSCAAITTVADGSMVADAEVYRSDREGGISGDLNSTAAQDMNSLSWQNLDFVITPTLLGPGDMLDIRVFITYVDTATGTAVIGRIGAVELLLDVKG